MKTSQQQATKETDQKTHTYYQMRDDVADKAVSLKLSATAYRLWIHLCRLFPFGDRTVEMPSHAELALTLEVSIRSVFRAAAELSEADLWTFQVERWKGRNLTGHKSTGKAVSQNDKDGSPTDRNVTDADKDVISTDKFVSQNDKDGSPTPLEPLPEAESTTLHTLQTLKTIQTLSESDRPKNERENDELFFESEPTQQFREWLIKKREKMPIPPEFPEQWIQKQAQKQHVQKDFRDHLKSKNRTSVPPIAAAVENNFPKAFVDMNPTEQAEYRAAIAAMRTKTTGGDPDFANLANAIASNSIGTHS